MTARSEGEPGRKTHTTQPKQRCGDRGDPPPLPPDDRNTRGQAPRAQAPTADAAHNAPNAHTHAHPQTKRDHASKKQLAQPPKTPPAAEAAEHPTLNTVT